LAKSFEKLTEAINKLVNLQLIPIQQQQAPLQQQQAPPQPNHHPQIMRQYHKTILKTH
jgi:hypothetical protein